MDPAVDDRSVPASQPGRRERHKHATRERIFECAVRLFTSKGYGATSIEDIASCADVARATVFNYFSRKEEIISEWLARRRARVGDLLAVEEDAGVDTATRLAEAMRALAKDYEDDPTTGRGMIRAWLRAGGPLLGDASQTADLFTATIRFGQEHGDVAQTVDATTVSKLLLDVYLGILYRWAQAVNSPAPLGDTLLATLAVTLDGITPRNS